MYELQNFLVSLLQQKPDLLRQLVQQTGMSFPPGLFPCKKMVNYPVGLLCKERRWLAFDFALSREESNTWIWPQAYLIANQELGNTGQFVIFTNSEEITQWCKSQIFQKGILQFFPTVLNITNQSAQLLSNKDYHIALLGFWASSTEDVHETLSSARRIIGLASAESPTHGLLATDWIFRMSPQKVKTMLFKELAHQNESSPFWHQPNPSPYLKKLIEFLQERGKNQARVELLQEWIFKRIRKEKIRLSPSIRYQLLGMQQIEELEALFMQLYDCSTKEEILSVLRNIRYEHISAAPIPG